jgi:integrase
MAEAAAQFKKGWTSWRCCRTALSVIDRGELDLVFPNGEGGVQFHINIHRRGLGPLQVAAGITTDPTRPKYGLHSLRHAAASVQRLLGHSTVAMTLDTYTHLFPDEADDQAAMAQLQARLLVA